MARLKTYLLAAATVGTAFGIGFVMQHGFGAQAPDIVASDVDVDSIMDTSSATLVPYRQASIGMSRAAPPVVRVAAVLNDYPSPAPLGDKADIFDCAVSLTAELRAGAIVGLDLSAPCYTSERVTFHHQGLMFTEMTDPGGALHVEVPALSQSALFVASFDSGDGAAVRAEVPALPFYDRVALQWNGTAGLQLHAREFGADYFSDGHVWAASAGDMSRTAKGEGGFMNRLGNGDGFMAEIYSFPIGTARRDGTVTVTIEAEITPANCGTEIEAQTFERHEAEPLRVRDLTLDIPDCDDAGGFLVLKNLVEDLKIASR